MTTVTTVNMRPLRALAVLGALQPGVLAFVQQGLPRLAPRACARVGALCCRVAGDTRPAAAPVSRRDTVVGAGEEELGEGGEGGGRGIN